MVILGKTGRNFAAGMSGGIAYLLHGEASLMNMEMIDLERVQPGGEEEEMLRTLVENHLRFTGSPVAQRVLEDWNLNNFVKVMPKDYARVLRNGTSNK